MPYIAVSPSMDVYQLRLLALVSCSLNRQRISMESAKLDDVKKSDLKNLLMIDSSKINVVGFSQSSSKVVDI